MRVLVAFAVGAVCGARPAWSPYILGPIAAAGALWWLYLWFVYDYAYRANADDTR